MKSYAQRSKQELLEEQKILQAQYEAAKARGLKLDMSRGKPGSEQLELSMGLLDCKAAKAADGTDCRNYGILEGIPEARSLMAGLLGVAPEEVLVGGSSSLNLMYDAISRAITHGLPGSDKPWCKLETIKFLCPTPGYDRHFAICQHFGIKMIPIAMTPEGPDMEQVEGFVNNDPEVKGIWCVPKYSNPQGYTYSKKTVERFARLRPAAPDFRIFWDNAYAVHDLYEAGDELENILTACRATGREDLVYIFGSTSKITFAGAGLAAIAASAKNIAYIKQSLSIQTIGYDKMNQLAHARYFGDIEGLRKHMQGHAALLRPKFERVLEILQAQLGELEIACWSKPRGGYFISLDVPEGCARRTLELCKQAGVVMTPAGATHPYGYDAADTNIRIAPTFPPLEELGQAAELLCLCVRLAALEALLELPEGE